MEMIDYFIEVHKMENGKNIDFFQYVAGIRYAPWKFKPFQNNTPPFFQTLLLSMWNSDGV